MNEPSIVQQEELGIALTPYREAIDDYIKNLEGNTKLLGAAKEALSGGKRLRPIIALLVCEAVCGDFRRAMPVAAAFEIAHAASLVQDDIIDESSIRHGKLATHRKYGAVKAILVSDSLLFRIFLELGKLGLVRITKNRLAEILSRVGTAANLTAEGEFYEIELAEKDHVSEDEYRRLAELKTGSLFAASAACGALAAGAGRRVVNAMHEFGLNVGVAFQITDDILDIIGNAELTGKPILKDIQNNAINAVIVHALSRADSYQKQRISSLLYKKWFAMSDVQGLMKTLEELGSIEYSNALARRHAEIAGMQLRVLPRSGAREKLELLAERLEARRR